MHQAEDGKQQQGLFHVSRRTGGEWRVVMGKEGTDSDHLRTELSDKEDIFYQMLQSLSGTAHYDSGSRLETDAFQIVQAAKPVGKRHTRRMQPGVMGGVVGFMAQEIAVGSGPEEAFIGFGGAFSQ